MPNERLRAALLESGLTPYSLGDELGVDHKTVERWIAGRTPYRRHRYVVATRLGKDEVYLWPGALPKDQVTSASQGEILAIHPHRWDAPRETWKRLFSSAEHEIGVLVYAALFLSEDTGVQEILTQKARAGVRVRMLLGDPESPEVAQRGMDEGIGEAVAVKIRNVLALYRDLRQVEGIEFRFHSTPLYNSIYRADDELLVNTHILGMPATRAPLWHLRKVAGGEIVSMYLESFERVWETGTPIPDE